MKRSLLSLPAYAQESDFSRAARPGRAALTFRAARRAARRLSQAIVAWEIDSLNEEGYQPILKTRRLKEAGRGQWRLELS